MHNPMLAQNFDTELVNTMLKRLEYLYVETKHDGVRVVVTNHRGKITLHSRSGRVFRNDCVNKFIVGLPWPEGIHDMELVIGDYPHEHSRHTTTSFVNTNMFELPSDTKITLFVFYSTSRRADHPCIQYVEREKVYHVDQIHAAFCDRMRDGYEGIVIKSGIYKNGRSTLCELMRLVSETTITCTIKDIQPAYHNNNPETTNSLGYTERSAHKENKLPTNYMGTMIVETKGRTQIVLGTFKGLTRPERRKILTNKADYVGRKVDVSYKELKKFGADYSYLGAKFVSFRPDLDLF